MVLWEVFCEPVWTLFGAVRAPVHVDAGTLDLQTLEGEDALDLVIEAPNAELRFDRGAVSVRVKEGGTCIVVMDGEVEVASACSEDLLVLGAGAQAFVPRDGGHCTVDREFTAKPEADERLESLRALLVDVESGVY